MENSNHHPRVHNLEWQREPVFPPVPPPSSESIEAVHQAHAWGIPIPKMWVMYHLGLADPQEIDEILSLDPITDDECDTPLYVEPEPKE